MTHLTELDYESIENAVMETARGRWFLSEHRIRHGGADTPKILDAIARLEKVMASINNSEQTHQTNTAATAVTPAAPFAPAAIDMPAAPDTPAPQTATLSNENLQFFSNDEDLFSNDANSFLSDAIQSTQTPERPATPIEEPKLAEADIQEASVSAEPEENSGLQRDRFKIFKTAPAETPSQDAEFSEPAAIEVPDPSMLPTPEEQDRIVVIRDTSGEDIDIPLADELADTTEDNHPVPAAN